MTKRKEIIEGYGNRLDPDNPKLINLTPHPITLCKTNGEKVTINSRFHPAARVILGSCDKYSLKTRDGEITIIEDSGAEVNGLPDPIPGVIFIVSLPVAKACPLREDIATIWGPKREGAAPAKGLFMRKNKSSLSSEMRVGRNCDQQKEDH